MATAALRTLVLSPSFPRASTARTRTANLLRAVSQQRSISLSSSYLVTPKELSDALKKNVVTKISTSPRVIPICAAWFMPNDPQGRKGIDIFKQQRIPQARFFDIDGVTDSDSPYPHMLPSRERFAEAMQEMGIRADDTVVVYDTAELGLFSAPRVGWTLRYFGHPAVHVLNNFRLWVKQGFPTESGEPAAVERSNYTVADVNHKNVVDFKEMKTIAQDAGKEGSDGTQVLDARPYGRWAGTDKEPREGLSSGHIPGSKSVPFGELLDPESKTLLPAAELRKIFESKGLEPGMAFISSCGSGVTAAIIDLALEEAGFGDREGRRLYDGSWTEWAQRASGQSGLIRKK